MAEFPAAAPIMDAVPDSVEDVAAVLSRANAERLTVRIGNQAAERLRIGQDARCDIRLSLDAMSGPIQHFAGDLVATLPAGCRLSDANAALNRAGQWLPLDPPGMATSTIGAIVATNASGPRRHRYGTPRDLIIGIEMVLADGRIARAGGRVVKNVAGYDLARLMCGSSGSLAVITSATFKLTPVPQSSCTVVIDIGEAGGLTRLVQTISMAPLTPTAIELETPPLRLMVRFETTSAAASRQAEALVALCKAAASATVIAGDEEHRLWQAYEARMWTGTGTLLKAAVLPAEVAGLLALLDRAGLDYAAGGRAALGVLAIRLRGQDRAGHADCLQRLKGHAAPRGGRIRVDSSDVLDAAANVETETDDAWPLMRAVKARFDPLGILNPGAGPGGL